jgi:hypothetical protein
MRAQMGAYASWANTSDPAKRTKRAREAFLARFLDEVDPDRLLSERERQRRAESARKRYFTELAYRSSRRRAAA